MGLKPSDYRTVPLTPLEHHRLHAMGEVSYWEKVQIIPEIAMADMLIEWLWVNYRAHVTRADTKETALEVITRIEKFLTAE